MCSRTTAAPPVVFIVALAALGSLLLPGVAELPLSGPAEAASVSSATPPSEHVPLDSLLTLQSADFPDFDFIHQTVTPRSDFIDVLHRVSRDSLTAYIKHLEDYGTRYVESPQIKAAENWLERKLKGYGYLDTGLQSVAPDGKVQLAAANVVATKLGASVPGYRVVVCGHYDSIVSSDQGSPMDSAPGADDNASGSAATLEIARVLTDYDLDATVQFVLFTAEETGLHGSKQMAAQFIREGIRPEDVFVLNMDMIANMDIAPWKMIIYDDPLSRPLALLAKRITETYTSLITVMPGISTRSDHYPFQEAGYPAIAFHEDGPHPYYHRVDDKLIHLEMDYATEVVRTVLATVLHVARIADPPQAVRTTQTASGDLIVEWNHSLDADVLGYRVELLDAESNFLADLFAKDNFVTLDRTQTAAARWVRVRTTDILGESDPSEPAVLAADEFLTIGVTPNPTSGEASLDLFIPGAGEDPQASVRIFDAAGRLVRTLHDGPLPRGSNRLTWEDANARSGVYFYLVDVRGIGKARGKIMLVR